MKMSIALVPLLFFVATASFAARGPDVTCESVDNKRTLCRIPGDGRVQVEYRISDAPCDENRSWRRTREGIEVKRGCRAVFSTTVPEPEPPNYNTYIDLLDTDADSASATLLERGYTFIGFRAGRGQGEIYRYFRTPGRSACLRAKERGGIFRDLDGVSADDCR